MKTKLILISFALFVTLGAFLQPVNAQEKNNVLKNSKQRSEIFKSIAGNPQYMTEFMNMMKTNNNGLDMMVGDLMDISKKDNDVGVRIGNMMMNDPQYMNLMMTQMINRANKNDAFGKNMLEMMKNRNHLYGMMQNMMNGKYTGNNLMGNNHMGNSMHNGNTGHSGMMRHGHGIGNGMGNSSAHSAHLIK